MPILLFLCFFSVLLQFYVYLRITKHDKTLSDEVFNGAWFKQEEGHAKRGLLFYYNPLSWNNVKQKDVILALIV